MSDAGNNSMGLKGILSVAALVMAGCAGNGEGLDANGEPITAGPPVNSDFQQIQATIFTPICTACHTGANAPQGLRLDAANSYALLVNVASAEVPSVLRVNPGNPDSSYLVQKIQGTAAVGGRMPLGGPALSQAQIDLVRQWISSGAPQSSSPTGPLKVTSSIPAASEQVVTGLDRLTIIFNSRVDVSLVAARTFVLRDAFDEEVPLLDARVPSGRPNVVELRLPGALATGSYQLEIRGSGPVALADDGGHVLDGDADGASGGDAVIPFDVNPGASR
jgi:mono/diheme cytochrome c family protein